MTTDVINCGDKSLPRSIDVSVSVSTPQVERATGLTLPCLVTSTGTLPIGAGRIRIYSDIDAVLTDWGNTSEAYYAARDFFAQPTRPNEFAIAQAFDTPQSGFLTTGQTGEIAAFTAISDGSFAVSIDAVSYDVTALDFTSATNLDDCATIIQAGIIAAGGAAGVVHDGISFVITSAATGDGSSVSVLAPVDPVTGTDISGTGLMNGQAGEASAQIGYTPTGIDNEMSLIQTAAGCNGKFIYGWILDETYRDSNDVLTAAAYVETLEKGVLFLCSNDTQAKNPAFTADIGSELAEFGYLRTVDPFWMTETGQYPDAALAAIMLGVDYSGINTAITAKFKDLIGIQTQGVSTTDVSVLESKGYNLFTRTGNTARVVREGTMVSDTYYIDDRINLDNFVEELQTAVYNVFLRNGKVPYTENGLTSLRSAATKICQKYVDNGVFASRVVQTIENETGVKTVPAYAITFPSIATATASDRAQRKSPPMQITVYLAGAIHSIDINVTANT